MTDSSDRSARGEAMFQEIVGISMPLGGGPLIEAARDFIFSEVWTRPGLDRRSRRWITIACVCAARSPVAMRGYMAAALDSGDITVDEMQEFLLHFAVYQGFPKANEADAVLREILQQRIAERGSEP